MHPRRENSYQQRDDYSAVRQNSSDSSASSSQVVKRSKSHSRLQIDPQSASPDTTHDAARNLPPPSPLSLLAYANSPVATSFSDQDVPPSPLLPHPHAPKAISPNSSTRPAIYRNTISAQSLNPGHRQLLDTLAIAAAAGYKQGPLQGRSTIHGRTSYDLLTASGPVPIEFGLNRQQSPQPQLEPHQHEVIPSPDEFPQPPTNVIPRFVQRSQSGPSLPATPNSVHDAATVAASQARPNFSPGVGHQRPRSRSFSDIISAIETPR